MALAAMGRGLTAERHNKLQIGESNEMLSSQDYLQNSQSIALGQKSLRRILRELC